MRRRLRHWLLSLLQDDAEAAAAPAPSPAPPEDAEPADVDGPPAHWVERVKHAAPELLRPPHAGPRARAQMPELEAAIDPALPEPSFPGPQAALNRVSEASEAPMPASPPVATGERAGAEKAAASGDDPRPRAVT